MAAETISSIILQCLMHISSEEVVGLHIVMPYSVFTPLMTQSEVHFVLHLGSLVQIRPMLDQVCFVVPF